MSLEQLGAALTSMPPTGEDGFEGLAAALLQALTGYRFYVARSGDQPADALSVGGDIALQGKRYDKTPLDETDFEGDFSKATRTCRDLDCYVLATTRRTAQLGVLAKQLEDTTGVDIILLGFANIVSEVPALCVTFWRAIENFSAFSSFGRGFTKWAAVQAQRSDVQQTVERLHSELTASVPLGNTVAAQLTERLKIRFGIRRSPSRTARFPIDLAGAVRRSGPYGQLRDWWSEARQRCGVVLGEEGMGKSTVAADFGYHLASDEGSLILWLDSADWTGARNIDSVLDVGFRLAGFNDMRLRERLVRKALARWPNRTLIVLDGVNERGARDAAQRLLAQLQAPDIIPCRILFTTRPIGARSDENALWNATQKILVQRFTEQELEQALAKLPSPIQRKELPAGLVEVAKIPRYFLRAVELRRRFLSFENVSKEMVLWADLLAKITEGDQQVRDSIGWDSAADAKRALRRLADAARSIKENASVSVDWFPLLKTSFENRFEQIRSDLAEQRIVLDPDSESLRPSPAHIILGFALHLADIASTDKGGSIGELGERLSKELEPVLSNDDLTEALFITLQLSAFPQGEGLTLSSRARSALLLAWASNQNSYVSDIRLTFWAKEDLPAYLDFVEEMFMEPVSQTWADLIIAPLKGLWRAQAGSVSILEARLRRWLKLVWKSHGLRAEREIVFLGETLPIALHRHQLNLSYAALAIVAEHPLDSFVRDLAIASASSRLSTERHVWPKSNENDSERSQDIPCKDLYYNLGPVLRWRFTESIKPALVSLESDPESTQCVQDGVKNLLQEFGEFGWRWSGTDVEYLRNGNPLFPPDDANRRNRFCTCPELAIRGDIPDLSQGDQEIIREKVEGAFASEGLCAGLYHTQADSDFESHLSWYARSMPQNLQEKGSRFRLTCLKRSDPGRCLDVANLLPYDPKIVSPTDLLAAAKEFIERRVNERTKDFDWSVEKVHVLAFTCFRDEQLKDWLIFASRYAAIRRELFYFPIPALCPFIVSEELATFAREQARQCWGEPVDPSDRTEAEFDYWALVGSLSGAPDAEYHEWIDGRIRNGRLEGHRRFYSSALWFRTATEGAIAQAINSGSVIEQFTDDALRPMFWTHRAPKDWEGFSVPLNALLSTIAIDDVGNLLQLSGRTADLDEWGRRLFTRSLQLVGRVPFERRFWGRTVYTRDDDGRIYASNCDREEESSDLTIDAGPRNAHPLDTAAHIQEMNRRANEGLRIWHGDLNELDKVEKGAFSRFSAFYALEAWRDQNPAQFKSFSLELLDAVINKPAEAFHLGGFIAAVIDCLVPMDPRKAFAIDTALSSSSLRVRVINEYGQSTFEATIWREAANGNAECKVICLQVLRGCTSDAEFMSHAVIAQAEGATHTLSEMCENLLREPLARDRALAVSLLAWMADDQSITRLGALSVDDPSGWIREHAKWAHAVAEQERSVRDFYANTLQQLGDTNKVLTRLQIISPALTSTCKWWHRHLEEKAPELAAASNDSKAALTLFWHDVRSHTSDRSKIFGRELKEYLRGERIRDLRTPKPRLLGD
ncbi:MAG TPA: NACHT domain-containing protein [Chthoniobacterales bacterium]|nr:NACHT domain-containing protein [Chthoniobacterales bacterium]